MFSFFFLQFLEFKFCFVFAHKYYINYRLFTVDLVIPVTFSLYRTVLGSTGAGVLLFINATKTKQCRRELREREDRYGVNCELKVTAYDETKLYLLQPMCAFVFSKLTHRSCLYFFPPILYTSTEVNRVLID